MNGKLWLTKQVSSIFPFYASVDRDIMANNIAIIILLSHKYLSLITDQENSQKQDSCWTVMPHFPPWNNVFTTCVGLWELSLDRSPLWADNDSTSDSRDLLMVKKRHHWFISTCGIIAQSTESQSCGTSSRHRAGMTLNKDLIYLLGNSCPRKILGILSKTNIIWMFRIHFEVMHFLVRVVWAQSSKDCRKWPPH